MITLIEVDGFKSLRDFSLSLHEGLNVLVGPNGAGKTNIIRYLEFMSSCIENGVSRTVTQFGGSGTVFRKIGENNYVSKITSTVYGSLQLDEEFVYYELLLEISLTEPRDKVYISRQRINIQIRDAHTEGKIRECDKKFDLELGLIADESGKIQVNPLEFSDNIRFNQTWIMAIFNDLMTKSNPDSRDFNIAYFCSTDEVLFDSLGIGSKYLSIIKSELVVSAVYSLNPEAIRKPDDRASEPGIQTDGSGVYSTLYAVKSNANSQQSRQSKNYPSIEKRSRNMPQDLRMDTVLEHIRLANESIENVSVESDTYNNQFRIKVSVLNGVDEVASILPFSLLSDGTVKWFSLVTLILTNPSITCIEEPENHLHPRMQSIFIDIIRDCQSSRPSSTILTTHSETLLNELSPDEVVCVSFENGRTIASRPSNSKAVEEEMRRTGFGLGYYYTSGGLEI